MIRILVPAFKSGLFCFYFVYFSVADLNSTIATLGKDSQQEIYNHIIQTLQGNDAWLKLRF